MVEKKGRGRQGSARRRSSHALFLAALSRAFSRDFCRSKQFNIAFCVSTLVRMHNVELAKVVKQREATTHNATSTAEQPQKTV